MSRAIYIRFLQKKQRNFKTKNFELKCNAWMKKCKVQKPVYKPVQCARMHPCIKSWRSFCWGAWSRGCLAYVLGNSWQRMPKIHSWGLQYSKYFVEACPWDTFPPRKVLGIMVHRSWHRTWKTLTYLRCGFYTDCTLGNQCVGINSWWVMRYNLMNVGLWKLYIIGSDIFQTN